MYLKEVVEHAFSTLARVDSLVDKVVHLAGQGLTAYSKDSTLPRSKEVNGTWLEGVVWVEYLLGHVKGVVALEVSQTWCCSCCRWWRNEIPRGEMVPDDLFGIISGLFVD